MRIEFTNAVCSTRLRRVQFGVPPNCHDAYTIGFTRVNGGNLYWQTVSGATPETTRETRVLHNNYSMSSFLRAFIVNLK
jgi:hypothetical protein